jgi:hypothetical protein
MEILTDDFSINVPIKPRMSAQEFLALADKLEKMAGKKAMRFEMPKDFRAQPTQNDFRLDPQDELRYVIKQLQQQMTMLEQNQSHLERHERHITHILNYLQSLDNYIRKE